MYKSCGRTGSFLHVSDTPAQGEIDTSLFREFILLQGVFPHVTYNLINSFRYIVHRKWRDDDLFPTQRRWKSSRKYLVEGVKLKASFQWSAGLVQVDPFFKYY